MAKAPSSSGAVRRDYTELPPGMPTMVRTLANEVTAGGAEPVREGGRPAAVVPGGRRLHLRPPRRDRQRHRRPGRLPHRRRGRPDGVLRAVRSAMAVMARILGIPARVAVGFLVPDRIAPGTLEYSSQDLHAWPELFFPGRAGCGSSPRPPAGPGRARLHVAGRARGQPDRRHHQQPAAREEPSRGTERELGPQRVAPAPRGRTPDRLAVWVAALAGVAGLVVLGLLALLPRTLRRSRRAQRLGGGPEEAWAELRATAHGPRGAVAGGPLAARHPAAPRALPRETRGRRHPRAPRRTAPGSLPTRSGPGPDRPGARAVPLRPRGADRGVAARRRGDLPRGAARWGPALGPAPRRVVAAAPWSARVPGGAPPHGRAPGRGEVRRRRRPRRLTCHFGPQRPPTCHFRCPGRRPVTSGPQTR